MKLKLFVWEDSLNSYGNGIMFAYAPTVEIARELVAKKMWDSSHSIKDRQNYPKDLLSKIHIDLKKEPKIFTEPYANYVWGSD